MDTERRRPRWIEYASQIGITSTSQRQKSRQSYEESFVNKIWDMSRRRERRYILCYLFIQLILLVTSEWVSKWKGCVLQIWDFVLQSNWSGLWSQNSTGTTTYVLLIHDKNNDKGRRVIKVDQIWWNETLNIQNLWLYLFLHRPCYMCWILSISSPIPLPSLLVLLERNYDANLQQ